MNEPQEILIRVARMEGGGWEADVEVGNEWCGGGTAPTPSGALDVAMDILYGDTNDHLNGNYGALSRIEETATP